MIPLATFDARGANVTSLQLQHHIRSKHKVYGGHIYHVYLNSHFNDASDDIWWLADYVANRPTCIAEIIPEAPAYIGTYDASRIGMGSVWLPNAHNAWNMPLFQDILVLVLTNSSGKKTAAALTQDCHDSPMSHHPIL